MRLHIPKHFESLGVMKTLKLLLQAYSNSSDVSSDSIDDSYDSFLGYNESQTADPVKRFLSYISSSNNVDDYILNYYTHRLYSLRGSYKIIDILKDAGEMLGFEIGETTYTVNELVINIESIGINNLSLFNSYMSAFFAALLYYKEIKETINKIILNISVENKPTISGNACFTSEIEVDSIYEN